MRIIEQETRRAFNAGRNFRKSNTAVITNVSFYVDGKKIRFAAVVYLYNTMIAARDENGNMWYSCGGWHTVTTRSRLSALGAPARIKNYTMIREDTGEIFPGTLTKF